MRIVVQNVPSEMSLQTVSLTHDALHPDNIYLFHCYHCGTSITKVKGNVARITAGLVSTNEVTVINQCYKCKENYTFQTIMSAPPITQLIISAEPNRTVSTFHCVICRTPIIQYNPLLDTPMVALLPMLKGIPTPHMIGCTRKDCGRDYYLREVVYI